MTEKIKIVQGNITDMEVDAIVNAANTSLLGGGGVDGAIHRAAGAGLLLACIPLKGCKTGQSKITGGYNLKAKHVIHTVGPVWHNGTANEEALLASCYKTSLELALKHEIHSIAFPSISTGAYGFPFEKAARIALETVSDFLKTHHIIEKVFLVCFSEKDNVRMKAIAATLPE